MAHYQFLHIQALPLIVVDILKGWEVGTFKLRLFVDDLVLGGSTQIDHEILLLLPFQFNDLDVGRHVFRQLDQLLRLDHFSCRHFFKQIRT